MNNNTSENRLLSPITIILGVSSVLCIVLVSFRVYLSSSIFYTFFVWNLFLAWIPLILSEKILKMEKQNKSKFTISILFFIWLLFFPNAPYILTDSFHLRKMQNIPFWYDLILILSFAWNGLMIGFVSLLGIQRFLNRKYSKRISWTIIISVLFLSGFGIYLGRFERWNSWDILTNPISLIIDISEKILNPFSHPKTFGVTFLFSTFLVVSYLTLFVLIKSKRHE